MYPTPYCFTIGPITSATEPAAAVTIAGRPPSTDITRPSVIDATMATFGSTPEMKEKEITSGMSARAVMMPASVSRMSSLGERMTAGNDAASATRNCADVVSAMAMECSGKDAGFSTCGQPLRRSR